MELHELIKALMNFDTLAARQWVADAMRKPLQWSEVPCPEGLTAEELAVAAGVVEMLAPRMGQRPPGWTQEVAQSPTRIYLVRAAESMPRLRRLCEQEGPEPLRRRHILAPPEFLTAA
jgi:hypothetical protein